MTQDVDPQVMKQAAAAWRQVHDEAAAAVTRLAGVLQGSAGMAGTDNGAHAWASKPPFFVEGDGSRGSKCDWVVNPVVWFWAWRGGPVSPGGAGFPRASEPFVFGRSGRPTVYRKAVRMACQAVVIWVAQRQVASIRSRS